MMDEGSRGQSPIFSKSYDYILWLLNNTEGYPKSERFRLAKRLEDSALNLYETLIRTTRTKEKREMLLRADFELERLRFYTRIAHDRRLINPKQYRYASGLLVEIGKLLGGWLKSLPGP